MQRCKTREEWLNRFVEASRETFKRNGYPMPKKVRASIGFTSKGQRGKRIGECWDASCCKDGSHEIFIRPDIMTVEKVAGVLTHELCHTAVGIAAKHGAKFKACALSLGLQGKMIATEEGKEWDRWAKPLLKRIGAYPASPMSLGVSTLGPKQTTRLIKCECSECGFLFRTTAKWIEESGELICPARICGGEVRVS